MKTLKLTREKGYVIIQMDHGKVNAIDTDMIRELYEIWNELLSEGIPPGIIFTGRPHCFSAGLDLFHQFTLGESGVREFWKYYHQLIRMMILYPAPVVGAITGYAPAGATILALCTDVRIMGRGEKHRIGMHEFVMSLQIPRTLSSIYASVLGEQLAWKAVIERKLFTADEAVAAGLVHEACEVEEVLPKAKDQMRSMLDVSHKVFARSKAYFNTRLRACVDYNDKELVRLLDELMATTADESTWHRVQEHFTNLGRQKKDRSHG